MSEPIVDQINDANKLEINKLETNKLEVNELDDKELKVEEKDDVNDTPSAIYIEDNSDYDKYVKDVGDDNAFSNLTASPIYTLTKITCSYNDTACLPNAPYGAKAKQELQCKDLDNPQSEYHAWLNKIGVSMPRSVIIQGIENGDIKATKTSEKDKPVVKKVTKPSNTSEVNKSVRTEVPNQADTQNQPSQLTQLTDEKQTVLHDVSKITQYTDGDFKTSLAIDKMFAALKKLNWRDRDEGRNARLEMTKKEAVTLYMTMKTLIEPDVVNQFRAIFNQLNNDELYDVLFHIIAKGQDFYYACLEDPTFCLYLSSQYQPLATTLYNYILQ